MEREKKTQIIDSLQETFTRSSVGVFTDYRGLPTSELTKLRRRLREAGSEYRVVKNTLARIAAERAGKGTLASSLEGPIAIAFSHDNINASVKVLSAYIRESQSTLSIKGGFLNDRSLTSVEVITLAMLPSREVLLSRVLGQMKAPIASLINCLNSPMRGVIGVLQARIKQMEVG